MQYGQTYCSCIPFSFHYDAIVGHDVLDQLGILLDFKEKTKHRDETEVAMQPYMPGEEEERMTSTAESTVGMTS